MQQDTLVFALCSNPGLPANRDALSRLKRRFQVRVISNQNFDTDEMRKDLKRHEQKDAYFATVGDGDPNEWLLLFREFANGRSMPLTLVMG